MAVVRKSRWRELLTQNLLLKLLAIGLAMVTIGVIRRLTSQEEEFEVPIVVRVAEGAAILNQDARTAYITCSGSAEDLRRLDLRNVRVVANPQFGTFAGTGQVPIGPRDVEGWLRGVTVKRVRPDVVAVEFDRKIESQIAVARPEIFGVPRIGRVEIEYSPRYVTVTGPESRIRDMTLLRTEPVEVTGRSASFETELKVLIEGEQWPYEIRPAQVDARIIIVTETVSRVWTNRPVRAMLDRATGQTVTLEPAMVDITVRGSPEMVEALKGDNVTAFVDTAGLAPERTAQVDVQVHLPAGIEVSSAAQPKAIAVTLHEPPPPEPEPIPEPEPEPEPAAVLDDAEQEEETHAAEAETER